MDFIEKGKLSESNSLPSGRVGCEVIAPRKGLAKRDRNHEQGQGPDPGGRMPGAKFEGGRKHLESVRQRRDLGAGSVMPGDRMFHNGMVFFLGSKNHLQIEGPAIFTEFLDNAL